MGAKKIVKSKSMLTEECHLNPFLERNGIEVVDTDLGEWIVQLRKEPPSHIAMPAIHTKREEIGELFHEHIGTEKGRPIRCILTRAVRKELRQKFLNADAGLTGVDSRHRGDGGLCRLHERGERGPRDVAAEAPHRLQWGIEKLIPESGGPGCSSGSWPGRRRTCRSRPIRRTSTGRGIRSASCISSSSTTAAPTFSRRMSSAVRSTAFAAGRA